MAVVGFAKPSAPQHTSGSGPVVLLRQLGLGSAIALVISNMIGTGIFISSGYLAGDLGTPFLFLIIWVVGAAFALAGAFCYSELGINFPSSGGEYVYLTRAYGPTWGFMTGWVSFFAGFSAPIAVNALAIADYLGHFWPALRQENAHWAIGTGALSLKVGPAQALGCVVIAVFTLVNCVGLGKVARLQNILTTTKVIVIIAFIALGFLIGKGDWSHFSMTAVRTSTTPIAGQFVISLFWIYFAYSGWNAATYVAEELKRPERTLPAALAIGTLVVAALYVGLNVMFLYAAPLESLKGIKAVASEAAKHLFGPGIAGAFAALVALCVMSSVNAMVTIGPRVYYAMAKNGAFFSVAAKVHPRWHTPMVAILCQGRLLDGNDADAVSRTDHVRRVHVELFRGDVGGEPVDLPQAGGLAEGGRGELPLSAAAGGVRADGKLDDHLWFPHPAEGFRGGSADDCHRRGGVSHVAQEIIAQDKLNGSSIGWKARP